MDALDARLEIWDRKDVSMVKVFYALHHGQTQSD
jgi:hypothetical protein